MLLSLFVYNTACKVLYHVIQSFEKYERDFESEFYGLLTVASACSPIWIVYCLFEVGEWGSVLYIIKLYPRLTKQHPVQTFVE